MRIVFMGTPEFAVPSLDILVRNGFAIPAVVTATDKPRGRGQHVTPTPVKTAALRHSIPVLEPASLRDTAFLESLARLRPDLIAVVAFRILPPDVFTLPRLGSFNLHASLLPKYRGAAPINWALINGEQDTGVTTFLLEEKVDTGGILLQRSIPIRPEDNAGTVHDALATLGAELVLETVRLLEAGKAIPRMQDNTLATPAPKIFKEDCRISWATEAARVHNRVRGLSPVPTAFTRLNDTVLKIYRTALTDRPSRGEPGTICVEGESLFVRAADRELEILELQPEGRKRMSAAEFLRGYHVKDADRFV